MTDGYRGHSRPEMQRFLPTRRRTGLEIWRGEGRFCAAIKDAAETWGIEPDAEAAERAAHRLQRVLFGSFRNVKDRLPRGQFDIIVCNGVIEYMTDHDQFLEEAKAFLTFGGVLVASVPNVRHYQNLFELIFARDWHSCDAGTLDRTHLRFFTERSLRRTFEQRGYQIDVLSGINWGIKFGRSRWRLGPSLLACAAIVGSFGAFSDIRYPQFAIVARVASQSIDPPTMSQR